MTHPIIQTLYVQQQGTRLSLKDDNIRLERENYPPQMLPIHHIKGMVLFGNVTVTPYLIHRLADEGKSIAWLSEYGRFKTRTETPATSSVLLRVAQHAAAATPERATEIARYIVAGKLQNQRQSLMRAARETTGEDETALRAAAQEIESCISALPRAETLDFIRGLEGGAARSYWQTFSHMIRHNRDFFAITERTRRPARDPINALLNFAYTILTNDCTGACQAVGLDPQVGFLHALRPGRDSLACDLVEEFRSVIAERALLTLINRRQLTPKHFTVQPGQICEITDVGRKLILEALHQRRGEEVSHAIVGRKVPLGLVPHVQARLLAQHLRDDRPHYPPYLHR